MIPLLASALLIAALPPDLGAYAEAGYDFGGELPKAPTPTGSVADFGAKPNDKVDDTDAFEKALEKGGVIAIPAGEYLLSRRLEVRKPGTILLGAGAAKTRLRFTRSLEELEPSPTKNTGGAATSQWSWSGGLLTFQGTSRNGKAQPLAAAKRGDVKLTLREAGAFKAGDEVVLTLQGGDDKLVRHLYAGDPGKASKLKPPARVELAARLAAVNGATLTLSAPLLIDLPEEFSPTIADAGPRDDYGLRGVGFALVNKAYHGHFKEEGWNPLDFHDVHHGWIDDVAFSGVDSGPFVSGAHVTVRHVLLEAGRPVGPGGFIGHHGVTFAGQAHRLEEFEFKARFHHDVSLGPWTNGNVVRAGGGVDLTLDFHKQGPFANLITNVTSANGANFFACGGGEDLGLDAGAWNIFWNLKGRKGVGFPSAEFCPAATTFVGVDMRPPRGSPLKVQPLKSGDPADLWLALHAKPAAR
jgi:hypothetical protein